MQIVGGGAPRSSRNNGHEGGPPSPRRQLRLALLGVLLLVLASAMYLFAMVFSILRLIFWRSPAAAAIVGRVLWFSGAPASLGLILVMIDLVGFLPRKRRRERRIDTREAMPRSVAVALLSYNDQASIGDAVRDFLAHPMVDKVIVVDNNSQDHSALIAADAGATVVTEMRPGYGSCAYRCLRELYQRGGTDFVVLCEGDLTFRARDLEKLASFAPHADVVNGTRIVEQLRAYDTQLSTFMYYGNFFVGKLLEIKHLGQGTFTDVGTTYKLLRRDVLPHLLEELDPAVNLEFNAHFMDVVLSLGYLMVECPVTFHKRVGVSKGGNASNLRALRVGIRMILGLLMGWRVTR